MLLCCGSPSQNQPVYWDRTRWTAAVQAASWTPPCGSATHWSFQPGSCGSPLLTRGGGGEFCILFVRFSSSACLAPKRLYSLFEFLLSTSAKRGLVFTPCAFAGCFFYVWLFKSKNTKNNWTDFHRTWRMQYGSGKDPSVAGECLCRGYQVAQTFPPKRALQLVRNRSSTSPW